NKSVSVVPGNTLRMLRPCVLRGLWKRRLAGRCISSSASSTWSEWATWAGWRQEEGPPQRILRLTGPVKLYKEAASEEVLQDLTSGELLIGVGEEALQVGSDVANGWLFVRRPTEESVEIMSDKPLEYQDGWIHLPDAPVEMAEHQLGDRLAGRVDVPDHPVTNVLKALPFCRGQELPDWIPGSVCELHTGKVGGVLKGGRFLLQRPSGAVPERLMLESSMLLTRKDRRRNTAIAAALGLVFATVVGASIHLREWLRGQTQLGRKTWPQLLVWLLYAPVLVTPAGKECEPLFGAFFHWRPSLLGYGLAPATVLPTHPAALSV
ncbi:unnamed protein product, partial [Durusdinium trenchii]